MALQQTFPFFIPSFDKFGGQEAIPRSKPPVKIEYRAGGDATRVISEIVNARNASINAAPGAGKSTFLPSALAEATKKLVVHVLPYASLAAVTHSYVKRLGKHAALLTSVEQDYPSNGLCLVSAGVVVAKWLACGEVSLPPCYFLHDESHESGAASAALRSFLPTARGVLSYVTMSATAGLDVPRRMETGGRSVEMKYEPSSFADPWSVEEEGAPWAFDASPGHMLLFEDDKKRAADLLQAYNLNGLNAYRLCSESTDAHVLGVFERMHSREDSALCVVIADSTFRSGYTFPVSTVIDSGKVRRLVCGANGLPTYVDRPIYEFERVQTASRGGRMPGLTTAYWRPIADTENIMCDLGQTDAEAFALVCRLLGYKPPKEASGASMARGKIPGDVCAALRGKMPLACLPDAQLVEVPNSPVKVARAFVEEEVSAVEVKRDDDGVSLTRQTDSQVREAACTADAKVGYDEVMRANDELSAIFSTDQVEGSSFVMLGEYCVANGTVTADTNCSMFPKGADSVKRVLSGDDSRTAHHAWSPYQRSVAVNALVHSHNVDLLQWMAWLKVLKAARDGPPVQDPMAFRAWAVRCAEAVACLSGKVETSLGMLLMISEGYYEVSACPKLFPEEEDEMFQALSAEFANVAIKNNRRVTSEKERTREWVSGATSAVKQRVTESSRSTSGGSSSSVERVAPAWLAWTAGYTGHPRPRTARISNAEGGTSTVPSSTVFLNKPRKPKGW